MVASELESVANSISTIWALFTFTFTNTKNTICPKVVVAVSPYFNRSMCCRLVMLRCKVVWWYIWMFSLLPYCFVNGNLYVANDPLGRHGPSRDAILRGRN